MGRIALLLGLGLVVANVLVRQQGAALLQVLGIRASPTAATLFSTGVLPLATPANSAGLAPLNPQPTTAPQTPGSSPGSPGGAGGAL